MTSTIHDLGYQRYDGERLSVRAAWSALFTQGVRTLFGLGRPARAKAVPVFVLVLSCLPAVISVFVASQTGLPVRHSAYFAGVSILYVLFAAAQAPELLSRDQANRVLPLVLSRDLSRWQYASARLAAMGTAMTALALAPQLVLWAGGISMAADPAAIFLERWPVLGPILAVSTLAGLLLGAVSSAVASLMSRRHLATAAIVGLFLVLGAGTTALAQSGVVSDRAAQLFNPIRVLELANRLLFDEPARVATRAIAHEWWVYVVALVAYSALAAAIVRWRVERMHA